MLLAGIGMTGLATGLYLKADLGAGPRDAAMFAICKLTGKSVRFARASLDVIRDESLLENCREMGARLLAGFQELKARYAVIGDVRGLGLMVAMELIVPGAGKTLNPEAAAVLENSPQRGLLAYMAGIQGHAIPVMPPLNVTARQVDEALTILDESFSAYSD